VAGGPADAAGRAAPAAGAAAAVAGLEPCPVAGCKVVLPDGIRSTRGYPLLARAHVVGSADLTASLAAAYGLEKCRWCQRPFRSARGRGGRGSLSSHEALCSVNPRRQRARAAPAAVPAAGGAAAASAAASEAGDAADLFEVYHAAWVQARAAFMQRAAPAAAEWVPLVTSGARTAKHVPTAPLGAWHVLSADTLDWVLREPEDARAWLWLLLLPSLVLHTPSCAPAKAPDRPHTPPSYADRVAAVLRGDFVAALTDRNAGVWRPGWKRTVADPRTAPPLSGQAAAQPTPSQRRALGLVRVGQLSAAARALCSDPPARQTAAVCQKTSGLFPPAKSATATTATVEAEFGAELAAAADICDLPTVRRGVSREAVVAAIRSTPRTASLVPSGLRPEHPWALSAGGQDALVAVVQLLAVDALVSRVPAIAAHALAGADLLLLTKPSGVEDDGLHGLRPIVVPETLRKLAASALAATVRTAAAELFAPTQLRVRLSSACERMLQELHAHVALHPEHAVDQYDYRNSFNLASHAAAEVVLTRALPEVAPYHEAIYGAELAPSEYGWASAFDDAPPAAAGGADDGDGDTPARLPPPPTPRLCLPAERGAQLGDPFVPLLHADALWLLLERLRVTHSGALVRAFQDDVVAPGPPEALAAIMADAATVAAALEAFGTRPRHVRWLVSGRGAGAGGVDGGVGHRGAGAVLCPPGRRRLCGGGGRRGGCRAPRPHFGYCGGTPCRAAGAAASVSPVRRPTFQLLAARAASRRRSAAGGSGRHRLPSCPWPAVVRRA